jgi:cytochrome c-type biogenesis protein CcmH/NrfG
MSDDNQTVQTVKTGWTSVQVYTMSVICLLVGVALGFLFRGSTTSQTPGAPAATTQMQAPDGNSTGGVPAGGMPAANAEPGPDQMKAMAEKKVAPLLEELKQNPKDIDALTKVGTYYMAARQFDESQKYFQMAVDVKPTADSWTKLSSAQFYGGAGDKAIESLNKALDLDPKSPNALYNLGMLKWQVKGDLKGAIACWEKLVKTNPNHPQIDQVKKMIARAKEHEKMPANANTGKPAM